MDSVPNGFEERLQAMQASYCKQLAQWLDQLVELRMDPARWEESGKARIRTLAHTLSGTGATFGFPAISEAAGALENGIMDGEKKSTVLDNLLEETILSSRAALASL